MSDSDMNPREAGMDNLLRRSMAAPVPRLSPDFDRVLSRELRRRSEPSKEFGQILLAGYGAVSAAVSIVVMRDQGLGWVATAVMTVAPLVMFELGRRLRRSRWGMAAK
jgi:hypothetical protein